MLDPSAVDLDEIAEALDDHSGWATWCIDTATGEVWRWSAEIDDDPAFDPELRADARSIGPLPSHVGYGDMEEFIDRVADRRAADLLGRAIAGRGAFRRFKDTLFEFPDLRQAWFRFRDTRMRRRAIEFLLDQGLVEQLAAQSALAELEDMGEDPSTASDPDQVAAAVAAELRGLYGARLVDVVLYGSRAKGGAHPDSDLDLAVILDEVVSPWEELRRMDDILWQRTLRSGVTVVASPFSRTTWNEGRRPLVVSARTEGVSIS